MPTLADLARTSSANRTGTAPVYDDAYLRAHSMQGLDRVSALDYGRGTTEHQNWADEKDFPLAQASQTLQRTGPTQTALNLAGEVGRGSVGGHQASLPERAALAAVPAGRAAAMVGSFLAPEVAVPADAILGMDAGIGLLHGGVQGVQEHPIRSAAEALMALSGASRVSKAASLNPGAFPSMVRGAESGSTAVPYKAAASISPYEHYTDALGLGMEANKAAKVAGGRDKSAVAALQNLKSAGSNGRFNMWARKNVDELEPRTQDEGFFGKPDPDKSFFGQQILDDEGRPLGAQKYANGRSADAVDPHYEQYKEKRSRSGNTFNQPANWGK